MGITILRREILLGKFGLWTALNVKNRPSDLSPRYVVSAGLTIEVKCVNSTLMIGQKKGRRQCVGLSDLPRSNSRPPVEPRAHVIVEQDLRTVHICMY